MRKFNILLVLSLFVQLAFAQNNSVGVRNNNEWKQNGNNLMSSQSGVTSLVMTDKEILEYIKEDEYVEVTPKSMRMRKIILDEIERKRANRS